eukprot:2856741-Rhodomonas_salina.1
MERKSNVTATELSLLNADYGASDCQLMTMGCVKAAVVRDVGEREIGCDLGLVRDGGGQFGPDGGGRGWGLRKAQGSLFPLTPHRSCELPLML